MSTRTSRALSSPGRTADSRRSSCRPGATIVTFTLPGFATLVQENVVVTVGQTVPLNPTMRVSGISETVTVTTEAPVVDTTQTASREHTERNHDRVNADPRTQVRGSADAHPGGQRRAGPRRRRNHVLRPARRVQQHQPRRRRLHQRLLRRAGGRPARARSTSRSRPSRNSRSSRPGRAPSSGTRLAASSTSSPSRARTRSVARSFHYQRLGGSDVEHLRRQTAARTSTVSSSAALLAVRSSRTRRSTSSRSKASAENLQRPNLSETYRDAVPGGRADAAGQRDAHQRQSPTVSGWRCSGSSSPGADQNEGPADRPHHQQQRDAREGGLEPHARRPTVSASANFDYSKNVNQTFDVATYGTSANGTEGPSKINVLNVNLFTTLTHEPAERVPRAPTREKAVRAPRIAVDRPCRHRHGDSRPSFRFGNPFFLQPNVDELVKRFQVKDNFSIVPGTHTIKAGGEWHAHETTRRSSAGSSRVATSSTASPGSCATRRRRRRAGSDRSRWPARTAPT